MDHLSRRDNAYQQFELLSSAVRNVTNAANASTSGGTATTTAPHPNVAPGGPLRRRDGRPPSFSIGPVPFEPIPPASSPRSPTRSLSNTGGGPMDILNRVGSSLAGALQNSPLNGAPETLSPRAGSSALASPYLSLGPIRPPEARHQSRQQQEADEPLSAVNSNLLGDLQAGELQSVHGVQSASQSTESLLPDYAPPSVPGAQAIRYTHAMPSPSGKIELTLESVGAKSHPVYVQETCAKVQGKVRLRLQGDDSAHELRIRVKGVSTTTVMRTQHNSARSVAEEEEFWYAGCTLWNAQPDEKKPGKQNDDKKPSKPYIVPTEVLELPFSIDLPAKVPPSSRRKAYPMPPSFILSANHTYEQGGIESASVRYYVKITLARKGLLRPNERLFAPIVYLTRASDLSFLTPARRNALITGDPLPSPLVEPDCWQGRAEEKVFKKGFFGGKKGGGYKIAILLPSPLVYGKLEKLPYFVRISSEDRSLLTRIGESSISVQLVQRCLVTSHGTIGVQENVVSEGTTELATEALPDASENTRRFKGIVKLSKAPATSFQSFNIEVSYFLTCRLLGLGNMNPAESSTKVPIDLISMPPPESPADARTRRPGDGTLSPGVEWDDPQLPPSYFEVVEQENRA